MNAQKHTQYVVVGVDGTDGNVGAIRYAAAEAASTSAVLRVAHVVPDFTPVSPMPPRTPTDLEELGVSILGPAVSRVHAMEGSVETDDCLRHGTRTMQLVEASEDAELLVVGRDDRPLLERLLHGDTQPGWRHARPFRSSRCPQAGIRSTTGPCWSASSRRSMLRSCSSMRSTWPSAATRPGRAPSSKLPSGYDDIIESRVDLDEWTREGTIEMEMLLREWRAAYPAVKVEIKVVHHHAGDASVQASWTADVVVIVRRDHGVPAASHLGGAARTVLRAAHCPVCIVPPTGAPPIPSLVLEEHGQMVK